MEYTTLIVLLALLQYFWFTMRVGITRGKYHVDAPACEGDENWVRMFRVQQNTLEQLILFIPTSFAFSYYMSTVWVLIPGGLFIIGRFLYSAEYIKDPKTRVPGMSMTILANAILLLGALFGLLKGML